MGPYQHLLTFLTVYSLLTHEEERAGGSLPVPIEIFLTVYSLLTHEEERAGGSPIGAAYSIEEALTNIWRVCMITGILDSTQTRTVFTNLWPLRNRLLRICLYQKFSLTATFVMQHNSTSRWGYL